MKKKSAPALPRRAAEARRRKMGNPVVSDARPLSIVGIGASAGGLEAFEQFLSALPADTGMAFVLVQHLAPTHESMLTELLGKATKMPVLQVTDGMKAEANHVYVIPPNAGMSIERGVLHLTPLDHARTPRMPIDLFLRSLAEDQQGRAIGVILSGTASDGTLGIQSIKALGGLTFAQDDGSAKYNAMPRSAIAAGHIDFVLPPDQIARELKRVAQHINAFAGAEEPAASEVNVADETLDKIFLLLRSMSRVDFGLYKHGTIERRIRRRMFLQKIEELPAYLQFLRGNPDEAGALFNDLLINVTGFFRDPEAFDALRKHAFPYMVKHKRPNAQLRVWVPGCSTGEEAYSLAIVLLEYLGEKATNYQIQIFATDVSDLVLQKARLGIYPENILQDIAPERLRNHFLKADGGYQISKAIRDMCIFAKQDIARDPPFSKLDMISCRNVMIYMGPPLQKRIIPLFHYALNSTGILFLGSSETVGSAGDLFVPIEKKYKIYAKKQVAVPLTFDFIPQLDTNDGSRQVHAIPEHRPDLRRLADKVLLNRYAPASVMVNARLDIVLFIGQTGRFLDPEPGEASLNLMKMVKPGLHIELRRAFQKATKEGTVRQNAILVENDGGLRKVNFEIIPVKDAPKTDPHYLIVFEETTQPVIQKTKDKKKPAKKLAARKSPQIEVENTHLREELGATREYLQSIIEEQRTTNEELRSANEEVQSSNEELQSINEELETAKEELQSTNEELTTVNEELQNRNDELTQLNNDLRNLLGSVNIPIIMVGNDLRIRRFTPMAEKILNLIPADIGRPIMDIRSNLKKPDLRQAIARVMDSLEIHQIEIEDNNGKWYSMTIRPYRTIDNKIDGVVIVFFDLDPRLRPKS